MSKKVVIRDESNEEVWNEIDPRLTKRELSFGFTCPIDEEVFEFRVDRWVGEGVENFSIGCKKSQRELETRETMYAVLKQLYYSAERIKELEGELSDREEELETLRTDQGWKKSQ